MTSQGRSVVGAAAALTVLVIIFLVWRSGPSLRFGYALVVYPLSIVAGLFLVVYLVGLKSAAGRTQAGAAATSSSRAWFWGGVIILLLITGLIWFLDLIVHTEAIVPNQVMISRE